MSRRSTRLAEAQATNRLWPSLAAAIAVGESGVPCPGSRAEAQTGARARDAPARPAASARRRSRPTAGVVMPRAPSELTRDHCIGLAAAPGFLAPDSAPSAR